MQNAIEFFCHDNDKPIEIMLEPECTIFIVSPRENLKFVGKSRSNNEFRWSLCLSNGGIQLFPDCKDGYDIEVYENGRLLNDDEWYKYYM